MCWRNSPNKTSESSEFLSAIVSGCSRQSKPSRLSRLRPLARLRLTPPWPLRPGWEERLHYAEILRLKGWMLSLKGDLAGAEANYLASLKWARKQQAKSWELRTSTSLAKLWQAQGKNNEALNLLKPVYEWFTEGFDTKDLKEAKALLAELK